ncbi:SAM-dependent methyltransferase [Microvirga rosea]|uniref:SAM-dependent methyltransferase n=1 Tax=Microvirga rosea TaxID=2715425 RepID=UPI001D0A8CE0|nr:class I SAM-dependent methyltransferase [Microvirga rosea]MCB8822983.1 class I SAM-dependent methyltransferase [Microvirga rosea]
MARKHSLPQPLVRNFIDLLIGLGLVYEDDEQVVSGTALLPFTASENFRAFRASLRAPLLQSATFHRRVREGSFTLEGWTHTDDTIIEAQADLTQMWARHSLSKLRYLPGLISRLESPGAALLDVGAGAAGLSIILCENFPQLSAVALEPAPHPAKLGAARVEAAKLEHRVRFRQQYVENIEDIAAFDLVFVPQIFLPDSIIEEAIARLYRAMRPGAWMLMAVLGREGHDVSSVIVRLKNLVWGGNTRTVEKLRPRLAAVGFNPVIRAPGSQAVQMICARRPPF